MAVMTIAQLRDAIRKYPRGTTVLLPDSDRELLRPLREVVELRVDRVKRSDTFKLNRDPDDSGAQDVVLLD